MLVGGWRVKHILVFEQGSVWREPLAVALAFDHDLVAGVGQPVEGAAREDQGVE